MSSSRSRRRSVSGTHWSGLRLCWTPELQPYSPCHRRLTSSQASLSVRGDDSSFVTSALSHDALLDVYADPCESDAYTTPIDVVRPRRDPRRMGDSSTTSSSTRHPRSSSAGCSTEPIHLTLQEVRFDFLPTMFGQGKVLPAAGLITSIFWVCGC